MTTPRPIEPSEIRVGDKVRLTLDGASAEGPVRSLNGHFIMIGGTEDVFCIDGREGRFTLLHRPEPPREPGSRWRDPETGAEYIVTDIVVDGEAHYCPYVRARQSTGLCAAWSDRDADIIARLVPLDGTR